MEYIKISLYVIYSFTLLKPTFSKQLYWNKSNPLFFEIKPTVFINLTDNLEIICPFYPSNNVCFDCREKYIVYMVNEKQYEECTTSDIIIVNCSNPNEDIFFTLWIEEMSPFFTPSFKAGKKYYLLSTSTDNRNRLGKNDGEVCCSNLRLIIDVFSWKSATVNSETFSFNHTLIGLSSVISFLFIFGLTLLILLFKQYCSKR